MLDFCESGHVHKSLKVCIQHSKVYRMLPTMQLGLYCFRAKYFFNIKSMKHSYLTDSLLIQGIRTTILPK